MKKSDMPTKWQDLAFGKETDFPLWELFHENSKIDRFSAALPDKEVARYLTHFHESLTYDGFPTTPLPNRLVPLKMPTGDAMASRTSVRQMISRSIKLDQLATLLFYGYGSPSKRKGLKPLRSFRAIPSAGALYPLELFVQVSNVMDLSAGLYHYNPLKHHLRLLCDGANRKWLTRCFPAGTIPEHAALIIFVTALFRRSTFKYGQRGYRFILLEAGHFAQNVNLAASALKLGCLNIGGFVDREADAFLRLDGISHSTIYTIAVGKGK